VESSQRCPRSGFQEYPGTDQLLTWINHSILNLEERVKEGRKNKMLSHIGREYKP
jgi:hypothetical protein